MGYLISLDTAAKISKDLKSYKKRVIFTHGTFDLFHAGHSLFLNKSKKKGDILVVCIEPDANIIRHKNPFRPIINQKYRAEILTQHASVDFVFFNDVIDDYATSYYLGLYDYIKPDIVTVGKNFFKKDRINEKVKGVEIKQVNAEIDSTTKIITSILNRYKSTWDIK